MDKKENEEKVEEGDDFEVVLGIVLGILLKMG